MQTRKTIIIPRTRRSFQGNRLKHHKSCCGCDGGQEIANRTTPLIIIEGHPSFISIRGIQSLPSSGLHPAGLESAALTVSARCVRLNQL